MSFAETKSVSVSGMTCANCVANVTKAVCEGLKYSAENCAVEIGKVTVTGDKVDLAAVETAIKTAGYEVVAPGTVAKASGEAKSCHGEGKSCADHHGTHAEAKPAKTPAKKK